jgi:hypothetical protein
MLHPLLKTTFPIIIVALLGAVGAQSAAAQSYSDSFEASSINPFWTIREQYGSVALSTDQHQSGLQSVKFSSTSGGQREMHLTHVFPTPTKGHFLIYFYDAAPGQETLYEHLNLYNSNSTDSATIGTQDFDAHCYTASLYNYNTAIQQGPNATCGVYPQTSTTNVSRTLGWHKLEINVVAGSVSYSIDGAQVFAASGDYNFDTVDVAVSGPSWRPNTIAYFDDFSFEAPIAPDTCAQQVQGLLNQISVLTQQNNQLQAQINDLTAQNGQLQQQVGALTTQNSQLLAQTTQLQSQIGQLQSQVVQLQTQLGVANQTIQSQQTQINQLQGAIGSMLDSIESNFRIEFHDPQFTIPGGTPLARLENLLNAILNLNHGRKQGIYTNLGGKQ